MAEWQETSDVVEAFFPWLRRGRGSKDFQRGKVSWGSWDTMQGRGSKLTGWGKAR